jgi:adenine-specific DNA-methyltransferase
VESIPDLQTRLTEAGESLDDRDVTLIEELSDKDGEDPEEGDEDGGAPGEYWRGAVRTGQDTSFREQRKKQFYPLYIDPAGRAIVRVGEPLLEDDNGILLQPSWEPVDGLEPVWPVDEDNQMRVWCFEPGRMRREIAAGNIKVGRFNRRRNTYAVNVRRVRRTAQRFREITVWWEPSYDAGSNGTNILKNLLGRSGTFPFPKSVYAVRDVLATVVGNRPEALIVDFFGGSGTTLHATCLLNAQDNGLRRTILVTNNEVGAEKASQLKAEGLFPGDAGFERHGIFQGVTLPRIKAVIDGKRPDGIPVPGRHKWAAKRPFAQGFPENCAFFHLDYLDPDDVELGQQFTAILPALWLAATGVGPLPDAVSSEAYVLPVKSPFGVLLRESSIRHFIEALKRRPDVTHVWLVTDSERAFADMRSVLPGHYKVSMLYRDYLRNFAIGTSNGK